MEKKKYIQNQSDTLCHPERSEGSRSDMRSFVADAPQDDQKNHIVVLLVNFGGPTSLNKIKPFLYNLFSDPTVLNFPFASLYRKSLAWLIANMRDMISRQMYKKTRGSSPLIPITYFQASKLRELLQRNNLPIDVFISFRYCKPFIEDTLNQIISTGYKKIVVLPLYPQYSYTTTGSVELVINKWLGKNKMVSFENHEARGQKPGFRSQEDSRVSSHLYFIKEWYKDEDYIQSYTSLIKNSLENLDLRSAEIIFSAHSIPLSNIENGDPYQKDITETVQTLISKLNWKRKWYIAYQSKIGPIKWLEPSTPDVIKEIAKRNQNADILVVPISFVSEHVETIYEIGVLYKELANKLGIKRFVRVSALNTDKYLIQALYNQVVGCLENNQVNIKELLLSK